MNIFWSTVRLLKFTRQLLSFADCLADLKIGSYSKAETLNIDAATLKLEQLDGF